MPVRLWFTTRPAYLARRLLNKLVEQLLLDTIAQLAISEGDPKRPRSHSQEIYSLEDSYTIYLQYLAFVPDVARFYKEC